MAARWFFKKGQEVFGPVSSSELRQLAATGRLHPDDQLRKEDMTQWVLASSVKQLFGPPRVPQVNPIVTTDNKPSHCSADGTEPSKASSASSLGFADRLLNMLDGGLRSAVKRGGSFAPYWRWCNCLVQWVQMIAGTRLPDGTKRTPTRACYAFCASVLLINAMGSAAYAIVGISRDVKVEYTRSYDFVQEGDRINLNQLRERVQRHEIEVERKMTEGEKGLAYTYSGACAMAALWCVWKYMWCRSRAPE